MKKLFISLSFLFISAFAFGQKSITITPGKSQTKGDDNTTAFNEFWYNGLYKGYVGVYSNPNDLDVGTGTLTSGKLNLVIQATPKMTIDNAGKVGIGTTSPQNNLHIHEQNSLNANTLKLTNVGSGTTTTDGLDISIFSSSDLFSLGASIMNRENASLYLGTNNSTIMNLSPAGNVGINNIFGGPSTGRFQVTHNTANSPSYPHINLKTTNNASNGMVRMENLDGSKFFGQYFNLNSATPANNFVSFDYGGTTPILDMQGNGNVKVSGFTTLGNDATAPRIKMKKLTGTTNAAQGGNVQIAHGIDPTKIIAINAMVRYNGVAADAWVGNGYTGAAGFEFSYQYDGGLYIYITNTTGNSANILSKDIKIVVTYEE